MPAYDFACDKCGKTEEIVCSMSEIPDKTVVCTECGLEMRRIFGCGGVVFKGNDWPGQEIKRSGEDQKIMVARRKAKRLKESGAVPWEEQIKATTAGKMFDSLEGEMRKKEQKKFESGEADRAMDRSIKEEESSACAETSST